MHWKYDLDQRSLVRADNGTPVKSVKLSFPDKYPLKVELCRGAEAYELTGTLRVTVKPANQPKAPALAVGSYPASGATVEGLLSLLTIPMSQFVKKTGERPAVLEVLVEDAEGLEVASWAVGCDVSRRYTDTGDIAEDLPDLKASQAEAEAGQNNTKWMSPLRVWQAIAAWATANFTWSNLAGKPTQFPPTAHSHSISDITNLQTSLDGKAPTGDYIVEGDARLSDARTPTAHSHSISDITNLQTSLDGKAPTGDYIVEGDPRLDDSRDPLSHAHFIEDVEQAFVQAGIEIGYEDEVTTPVTGGGGAAEI
jgi:hypothetical protein